MGVTKYHQLALLSFLFEICKINIISSNIGFTLIIESTLNWPPFQLKNNFAIICEDRCSYQYSVTLLREVLDAQIDYIQN